MKFTNVVVIEDADKLWGTNIKTRKHNNYDTIDYNLVYIGPVDIKTAEMWESRLTRAKTPYILVEAETTLENSKDEQMYARGYFILVEPQYEDEYVKECPVVETETVSKFENALSILDNFDLDEEAV